MVLSGSYLQLPPWTIHSSGQRVDLRLSMDALGELYVNQIRWLDPKDSPSEPIGLGISDLLCQPFFTH